MKPIYKKLLWLTAFSIAMGYLESAVVVYLRTIYYPNGFHFPLVPLDHAIVAVEFWREAATIVMLIAVGMLTGKNFSQKFAMFIYCFAVWDIFYYVFLRVLVGWPTSLFTWDILFLIPVPWVGPVLAPCILSLTMIVLTVAIITIQEKGYDVHLRMREWLLLVTGSLVIVFSFMQDFLKYLYDGGSAANVLSLAPKLHPVNEIIHYIPTGYNWYVFSVGEAIIVLGIVAFIEKAYKVRKSVAVIQ